MFVHSWEILEAPPANGRALAGLDVAEPDSEEGVELVPDCRDVLERGALPINFASVDLEWETWGLSHSEEIMVALRYAGYEINGE